MSCGVKATEHSCSSESPVKQETSDDQLVWLCASWLRFYPRFYHVSPETLSYALRKGQSGDRLIKNNVSGKTTQREWN